MSESIERKVQPFTIGTRLSVPAVAKCQEFTQSYLQNQSLDNCSLQRNLNSLYLSRAQVCPHGPCLTSVVVQGESPGKHKQDDSAAEDHLNQNIVSPSAVSRSIKKITISGNKDPSGGKVPAGPAELSVRGCISQNNNNNNNISRTSDPHLPRVEGVSSEDEAGSHFKISLPDPHKTQSDLHLLAEESAAATSQSNCFTQRNSLFHRDVLEAEAWIKSKLWDLKDGGNIQCCPLQDWDRAPQILCTDFKDFENRMVQLNQMGEQLICKLNPRSDTVKQQLTQLAERWQSLKRMAADQTRTRDGGADQTRTRDGGADQTRTRDGGADQTRTRDGGADQTTTRDGGADQTRTRDGGADQTRTRDRGADQTRTRDGGADQTRTRDGVESLQDLNNKVEKLEAWIKEKEEEGSPVKILKENGDKMQLTKRTLDLNRDEQHHRNLQEEINHLALKLEKWEKTDGKNISSRRKHVNKMCLKVQSHLNNYQEDLQQALEVSFFYQQADNTLLAITSMRKNPSASKELGHIGDKEMRDIAGQIMMLDVSVSQLCNLHPALAPSITQKQRELKDSWLHLQKDFRSNRPTSGTFTREPADPLTLTGEAQYVGTETQRIMGNQVREERHLKGCVSTVEWGLGRQLPGNQSQQQQSVGHTSSPLGDGAACADEVIGRLQQTAERKPKLASVSLNHPQLHVQLQKFTASADKTLSWLKDNVYIATKVCSIASCEGLEVARRCQYALEQDILNNKTRIEVVKREGHELVRARHPGSAKIEEFLTQLGGLWEELRRRHQRNAVFLQTSEELGFRVVKVLRALGSLEAWLESVELSVKESAPTGNPEMRSVAEESSLLETEVAARLRELHVLRQEVDHLLGHGHLHMQSLQARTEKLEQKYVFVLWI
ncbi:hypothetical protein fugu_012944 [Takifugu bimaculatus]|uniref:Uncharacterized protein n=1 Tax=Takifugu bimaculatus TaxID=433685 RepID=A0A4Z2C6S9_9TELE|nr:hypothetical protein fugu_012944 [Takifugu bimaculatus]